MRLLDWIYPPFCPLCRMPVERVGALCPACLNGLPAPPPCLCLRCGEVLGQVEDGCGRCLDEPLAPDATYCAHGYDEPITALVRGFKFGDHPEWAALLAELLWRRVGRELAWEQPTLIVPVPLHPWRLLKRRYNQSALLAGELAARLHCRLVTNGLKRIKLATPQARMGRAARLGNLRGAFVAAPAVVGGQAILLVDDVITTGATAMAAAVALKGAGAARVAVAALARTPRVHQQSSEPPAAA